MEPKEIHKLSKSEQIDQIYKYLVDAKNHGLLSEVVSTALDYQRANTNSSSLQSMIIGYSEWIK